MADDIQIKIGVVGERDILNVSRSIDALSGKTKKLASDFDNGRSTSQAYFKGLNQQATALKKLGFSYQEARKYVFDLAKAQREANANKALQSQKQELDAVLRSIDPVKNATDAYYQKLNVLNAAQKTGALTSAEYANSLKLLNLQAQNAGLVFKDGMMIPQTTKNMKMFRMQVQQAGYQVGDFFTQVSMGQNPLMAFATQATQLAGFFGGPWGAAVGAGISILGALGVAFMATRTEVDYTKDALKSAAEQIDEYNDKITMLNNNLKDKAELTLFEAILDVRDKISKKQDEIARADVESVGFLEQQKSALQQNLDELEKTRAELIASRDVATELEEISVRISFASAVNSAAQLASQLGIAADAASRLLAAGFGDIGGPVILDPRDPRYNKSKALQESQFGFTYNKTSPFDPSRNKTKTKGGGGGSSKEQEDYLKSLLDEANQKLKLVGLTDEQARRQEIIFELEKKKLPVDEARIEQVLKAEEALRKATEAEQRRQDMIDSVTSNIENAFMSMIDGSKSVGDAFKGMLREILLDIYRQQVAKPFASGIGNLLGGFLGGGFGGGTGSFGLPKPFANGGVVNGATMFPMASGKTGVMGEAGPEAIMPLKRGKDGKLGVQVDGNSQGTVVVNQTFNFAANGDESVKKIIAEAAPKIAQMTQQQILDSRRRGGQMKATFG